MLSPRLGTLTCLATLLLVAPACDSPAAEPTKAKQKSEVRQIEIKTEAKADTDKAGADKADAPAPDSSSDPVFALGEAKIMREGHADRAFELHADGKVTLAGTPYGTLETTGHFIAPSGAVMLTASADGSVNAENGPSGLELTATGGKLSVADLEIEITIGADGNIAVNATGARAHLVEGPPLQSEGCANELRPACTVVVLTYLMALGNPDAGEEK